MKIDKQIEMNVSDALIERPIQFHVGGRAYSLYPATLGKTEILKSLYLAIDVDLDLLAVHPMVETLRVCKTYRQVVCQIVAYSTFKDKASIMNAEKVTQRAAVFEREINIEDLAALLSLILSSDRTEEFVRYFGIDRDREKRQQINHLKGDSSSLTFGGKSVYGLLIDFACQRYGWTLDYILWGISLVNLNMLFADAITTVYLNDEERKKLGMSNGEVIDADDPANKELIRKLISE